VKAMVLAAGRGERLRPLTLQRAKPALRLVDRPVVGHLLDWLARWGVDEVVVNLHHLPESVRRAVLEGRPAGMGIGWSEEPVILGTGGGLGAAAASFRGESEFLLVNGDCLYGLDLAGALALHRERRPAATMVLMEHPENSPYRSVEVDEGGRVRRIAGRPEEGPPAADLHPCHFPGVHILGPAALEAIPPAGPSDIHADALAPLIGEGAEVLGVVTRGPWHDVGTPLRYLEATRDALAARGGGPYIAPSARVHPTAAVDKASVLGEGARVGEGVRVEASVLLDGAEAEGGSRLTHSILGYGTRLEEGQALERAVRVEVEGKAIETGIEGPGP